MRYWESKRGRGALGASVDLTPGWCLQRLHASENRRNVSQCDCDGRDGIYKIFLTAPFPDLWQDLEEFPMASEHDHKEAYRRGYEDGKRDGYGLASGFANSLASLVPLPDADTKASYDAGYADGARDRYEPRKTEAPRRTAPATSSASGGEDVAKAIGYLIAAGLVISLVWMVVTIAFVLAPIWLGAVTVGVIAGFFLAHNVAGKITEDSLARIPIVEEQRRKRTRLRVAVGFLKEAVRFQPHVLSLIAVTVAYGVVLSGLPFIMTTDAFTRFLLIAGVIAGSVFGTWAGRRVLDRQLENAIFARSGSDSPTRLLSPKLALGFSIPGLVALTAIWIGSLLESHGRLDFSAALGITSPAWTTARQASTSTQSAPSIKPAPPPAQPIGRTDGFEQMLHDNYKVYLDSGGREFVVELDWMARLGAERWVVPASAVAFERAEVGETVEGGAFKGSVSVRIPILPGYEGIMRTWAPDPNVDTPWNTSIPPQSEVRVSDLIEVHARGPREAVELVAALKRIAPQLNKPLPANLGPSVTSAAIPDGFSVPEASLSPDRRFGVLVPNHATFREGVKGQNKLVNVAAGKVVATIDAESWFQDPAIQMNHGAAAAHWSRDGSVLAWIVGGKWAPRAFNLLKVSNGGVEWQRDILDAAQREILPQTRNADSEAYEAAKAENRGSGSAYPDGFVIDVELPDAGFTLPLVCTATLDSNPKQIEGLTSLRASIRITVDEAGQLTISDFQLQSSPRRSGATGSTQGVQDFIRARLNIEASHDLDRILDSYADRVNYWDHGFVDRDFIRKDKATYFERWPETREEIITPIEVTLSGDEWTANFRTRFRVENAAKGVAIQGIQEGSYSLRLSNGAFKITAEDGDVLEKERLEIAPSRLAQFPDQGRLPGERYPETRLRSLSVDDLRHLSLEELQYAVNEMFARRGAEFPKAEIKRHFQQFTWYRPRPGLDFDQVEADFSELERENLKRLGVAREAKKSGKLRGTPK